MDPLKPTVDLVVGAQTYKLRFDFDAIAHAEDETGIPLLTGISRKDVKTPRISIVRGMLYAATLREHPEIAYSDVAGMVTRKTIIPIWEKVIEAWAKAMADEEAEAEDPNAQSQG